MLFAAALDLTELAAAPQFGQNFVPAVTGWPQLLH